jgi:proline iminopeptidase
MAPSPIPAPRESGFTTTTAVPLYWVAYGPKGVSPLLVLHGGPGAHHDYLLPQMLELAREHELFFYDQRGGGRSKSDDREPVTAQILVEDLAAVVREMGLEPLSLVGYSFGGLIALLYAIEATGLGASRPGRMVLIDPAPVTRQFRTRFEAEFARRQSGPEVERLRAELEASGLRESDPEQYRQRRFELSVAGYFADPRRARDLTPFRVMGRIQQSVWESLGEFDLRDRLRGVEAPTLVIHARQDPIPLESSREVADALPNGRLVVIEESGHVPYVEQPRILFEAITGFLRETEPGVLR